jgi:signal transduction histidine kinase
LGLAACAQIIGQLGGKISVESEVGEGTTFSVLLPVATESTDEPVEAQAASATDD